jgi:hypothetical protein
MHAKRNETKKSFSAFENRQTAQHFLRQKLEMLKGLSNQIARLRIRVRVDSFFDQST